MNICWVFLMATWIWLYSPLQIYFKKDYWAVGFPRVLYNFFVVTYTSLTCCLLISVTRNWYFFLSYLKTTHKQISKKSKEIFWKNALKEGEGIPLLNFIECPGVPLLNLAGSCGTQGAEPLGPRILVPLLHHTIECR